MAYSRWLGSVQIVDLVSFQKARGAARRAMRQAKNTWFQERVAVIEKGGFGDKDIWQAIRDIQCSRRGLVPSCAMTIFDEDGLLHQH